MSNFLIVFGAIIMFLGAGICVALTIILLCKNKKAMPFIIGIFGSMIVGGILLGIGCANQPESGQYCHGTKRAPCCGAKLCI